MVSGGAVAYATRSNPGAEMGVAATPNVHGPVPATSTTLLASVGQPSSSSATVPVTSAEPPQPVTSTLPDVTPAAPSRPLPALEVLASIVEREY